MNWLGAISLRFWNAIWNLNLRRQLSDSRLLFHYLSFLYTIVMKKYFDFRGQFWGRAALAPVTLMESGRFYFLPNRGQKKPLYAHLRLSGTGCIEYSGLKRLEMSRSSVKEEHGRSGGGRSKRCEL